ncbi:MAG: RluA family pseudouridine synthase [Deltaproteobacteria bacterium]|nr:RluA family pseudouridine synthase [Deltaproteobacteria bacterium]MBW1819845.1 RluA family pseudouridine synthase [Deltaproteobacteria bacterium]
METRLDVFLAECETTLSRSRIKALIKSGNVRVNNAAAKPGYRLKTGDVVSLSIPPPTRTDLEPEAVDFDIIHEDPGLIVVNKPAGIVVHPAPGHPKGTLVHGLLMHCSGFSGIGGELRPGIVHRLDKDTSGLLVIAKNDRVHASLSGQFKSRTVKKCYQALVHGQMPRMRGHIDLPIARHPKKRKEMSVSGNKGRAALTQWEALEEFNGEFTLLSIRLRTGRTHQIRVHLSHMGHAVVGDAVYGRGRDWWKRHPLYKAGKLPLVERQMLHADRLGFTHPDTGNYVEFSADLPDDMKHLLGTLRDLA